jgi:hypothetical protein
MATIRFHQTTTATPEQFVAAVTDFGPNRSQIFRNSADGYLKVHSESPGHTDVTEGANGVWERLSYDWSDPNTVVLTTTDSNVWGRNSGHTYALTRQSDGTTAVDVTIVREGKSLKGRLIEAVVAVAGPRFLRNDFAKTLRAIEARGAAAA